MAVQERLLNGGELPFVNGRRSLAWLPWLTLLLGVGATYVVWNGAHSESRQTQQDRFDFYVAEIVGNVEGRMRAYEQVLNGTEGLFAASASVARDEFKAYAEALQLANNYPGIQGLGFSLLVPARERSRHIARLRAEGFPDYTLYPEGERDVYSAIVYIEPFDWRNRRAFDYDMYANPVRREAMLRAWETSASAVSGKVTLVQETDADPQSGFLMYVPVYRHGLPHATPEQRRANLLGWAYAPFRMNDLMQGILSKHFGEKQVALDLKIFDGTAALPWWSAMRIPSPQSRRWRQPWRSGSASRCISALTNSLSRSISAPAASRRAAAIPSA